VLNAGESADVPEEDRDDKDDDEDDDKGDVAAGAMLETGAPADSDEDDEVVVGVVTAVAVGGGGLSPPPPSSVAPKGICIGRNGETTMPVGEEADAAGCAMPGRAPPPPQFVVPACIPPSKSDVEAGGAEVEAIALPRPEQSELVAAPAIGLKPGEASSEDPRGIPGDATGAPGPIPSGEVAPSEDGAGAPTPCARAVPQASRTIKTDMTNRTDIGVRDPSRWGFTRLRW
jgi:hypothetical protein